MDKIIQWGLKVLPHPPNSPDLAPCDCSFFPKLKTQIHGRRFDNLKDLQTETWKIVMSWPKEFFNDTMHELVGRWQKCVKVSGAYFEGKGIEIDPLFTKDLDTETDTDMETDSD